VISETLLHRLDRPNLPECRTSLLVHLCLQRLTGPCRNEPRQLSRSTRRWIGPCRRGSLILVNRSLRRRNLPRSPPILQGDRLRDRVRLQRPCPGRLVSLSLAVAQLPLEGEKSQRTTSMLSLNSRRSVRMRTLPSCTEALSRSVKGECWCSRMV
jgi:hypothetical protein